MTTGMGNIACPGPFVCGYKAFLRRQLRNWNYCLQLPNFTSDPSVKRLQHDTRVFAYNIITYPPYWDAKCMQDKYTGIHVSVCGTVLK